MVKNCNCSFNNGLYSILDDHVCCWGSPGVGRVGRANVENCTCLPLESVINCVTTPILSLVVDEVVVDGVVVVVGVVVDVVVDVDGGVGVGNSNPLLLRILALLGCSFNGHLTMLGSGLTASNERLLILSKISR